MFIISLLALCWFAMTAVHELGHVLGAVATGGKVERVVLHPFAVSRTDVMPNPRPGAVAWAGPLIGCLFPLTIFAACVRGGETIRGLAQFFAGFCLVANGSYLAAGSLAGVGDSGVMLRTGSPSWLLWAFGAATVPAGLYLWHRLGPLAEFLRDPRRISPQMAYWAAGIAIACSAAGIAWSPR